MSTKPDSYIIKGLAGIGNPGYGQASKTPGSQWNMKITITGKSISKRIEIEKVN